MLNKGGFDLWADGYDKAVGLSDDAKTYPFAGYKDVLGMIFNGVMKRENATVLDIGFGTGTLTTKLYEHGCKIYGQDFSPKMVQLASAKMPDAHLYQGDFTKELAAPLSSQKYDCIVATYSLHHLSDKQKIGFLHFLQNCLKDHGKILIGDVAFENRNDLEQCRRMAGDAWDDDEKYFIIDELRTAYPDLVFTRVSHCAGVLTIEK